MFRNGTSRALVFLFDQPTGQINLPCTQLSLWSTCIHASARKLYLIWRLLTLLFDTSFWNFLFVPRTQFKLLSTIDLKLLSNIFWNVLIWYLSRKTGNSAPQRSTLTFSFSLPYFSMNLIEQPFPMIVNLSSSMPSFTDSLDNSCRRIILDSGK